MAPPPAKSQSQNARGVPHHKTRVVGSKFKPEMLPVLQKMWEANEAPRVIAAKAELMFGFQVTGVMIENLARRNYWYRPSTPDLADLRDPFVAAWMRWAYPRPAADRVAEVVERVRYPGGFSMLGGRVA